MRKKRRLPPIGMRIIKSAVAVFLCFGVYLLRGQGMPFYSAIAAVLCMQPYVSNSIQVALNRTVGTLIGGVFGMVVLLFEQSCLPRDLPVLQYAVISLVIIPLIYVTLLVKKSTASYITCVVFMSITVSHGADVNPYLFAVDRMVDTLIGIAVSLGVNAFHLPRRRDKEVLLMAEDAALSKDGALPSYCKVKLNQLLGRGAAVTLSTSRTPASLLEASAGLELTLPVIVLSGAALYDGKTKTYAHLTPLDRDAAEKVLSVLDEHGRTPFVYTVIHEVLHIFHGDFTAAEEEAFYHSQRTLAHQSSVYGSPPKNAPPLCIVTLDTRENTARLRRRLQETEVAQKIRVFVRPDPAHEGLCFLTVLHAQATVENAAGWLCEQKGLRWIWQAAWDGERICVTEKGEPSRFPAKPEEAVRLMEKRFHQPRKEKPAE